MHLTEDEVVKALPKFLEANAVSWFKAQQRTARCASRTVKHGPGAVQQLLRKLTMDTNITEAVNRLHAIKQKGDESEMECYQRFEDEHARAGSPFDEKERVSRYINGLEPQIKALVHRWYHSNPLKHLTEVAEEAGVHGTTIHEMQKAQAKTKRAPEPRGRRQCQ